MVQYASRKSCFGSFSWLYDPLVLQTLADVCRVSDDVPLGSQEGIEELQQAKVVYSEEGQLQQLLSGQICMINFSGRVLV